MLRDKVNSLLGRSCELIKAGATRFGTNTLVGERLKKLKAALQQTVVDPAYVKEGYKDKGDDREFSNAEMKIRQNKGGNAKTLVLDDSPAGFWDRLGDHVKATIITNDQASAAPRQFCTNGW